MKISSALALLALLVPAIACTSAAADDGSESGSSEIIGKEDDDAGPPNVDGGATTACSRAGGTCVALSPSSCSEGTWANADAHSCGGAIGVGCCLPAPKCPDLVRPAPSFCPDGKVVLEKDENGCSFYTCVEPVRPTNACVAAGGECVAVGPSSCTDGTWGDASTYSCGGGVGVGCCFR